MKDYSAKDIHVLKGLEAVRKRPGMYIGSTGIDGLHHLVYEVIDNSIDEAMAGFCDTISVTIHPDNSVSVRDNGRGIPVDLHPEEGVSALELVLTRLHAGGKFKKDSYKISGGLHGVGVSVVNALSIETHVEVYREGRVYEQNYAEGIPTGPVREIGPTSEQGTLVRFKPDMTIFETDNFNFDTLEIRFRELAFLNKGITIQLSDERKDPNKEATYFFEGGLVSFIHYLNQPKDKISEEPVIYFTGEKDGYIVEIGMEWTTSYNELFFAFVNNINTKEGGTHVSGFRFGLTRVINEFFKQSLHSKKFEEESFQGEDVREGLTAVLSVKIPEPQFEGQTKTKLGNSEARGIVENIVYTDLTRYLDKHPKIIEKIIEKSLLAASARIAARKARELTRRKSLLEFSTLPSKLVDCSEKDPKNSELYIVEGDSAAGTVKGGRDRRTQAILPVWGKMLNVEKTRLDKILSNEKLLPLIATLGTNIGADFNIAKLRYHKVILMSDADIDGSHIRTLLLTFFFRYMPQIIENKHLYVSMPPLYLIEYQRKQHYAYNDAAKEQTLKRLGITADQAQIQRYKGLGEMNDEQIWNTTMDPSRRKLTLVEIHDAILADQVFSMLMGEHVESRRQFIEQNALYANLDV